MSGNSTITIDSNDTGLRIAEEASPCVLGSNPVWYDTEPNSYPNDFGGEITTVARNPINPGRQRKKGVPVDKDAASGFNQDLTQENAQRWLRGHFYADFRERADTMGFTRQDAGSTIAITNVDGTNDEYDAASDLDIFEPGDMILARGFGIAANNGLKVVQTVTADTAVEVLPALTDETPPATARLTVVGFEFGSGEIDIDVTGNFPALVRASGTKDFTDFGILPGEAVYVGGDAAGSSFVTAANNGRKRVRSVTSTRIEFDKSDDAMSNETGTGLSIQLFLGSRRIKNEKNPDDRVRRYYQFERSLGSNTGDTNKQAQYVTGAQASEFSLNLETASLGTADFSYIGLDTELLDENNLPTNFPRTSPVVAADAIKSESSNLGSTIVTVEEADAFNTSSDLSRIRLARVVDGDEAPDPIVGFLQTLTLTINQNAEGNKALGTFGSFNVSLGTFAVSAALTGYFSDIAAISAVENAEDVTLDWWQVKNNAGIVFDLPLITMSDGRPNVEQDTVVTIPLNSEAATGASIDPTLDHTLFMTVFDYLPSAADV